jgi:biopolymer transport protein ExbD
MKRFFITALLVLVLLGVIAARIFRHNHSQGLSVGIVVTRCSSPEQLRMIRLLIENDGGLVINNIEPLTAGRLPRRLVEIYETRWEKVLFIEADDLVSYQQVVAAIDITQAAVPGIKVMLITPSTRKTCDHDGIVRRVPF